MKSTAPMALKSAALLLPLLLLACGGDLPPYASTQPTPPQPEPTPPIAEAPPPYVSTQPVPPQPHPEHPIYIPPQSLLAGFLWWPEVKDVWLATPCEGNGLDEWCGHIPYPHVEHHK